MTNPMFWRIVWKEYRAQRGFWLAVFGMAVIAQLFVLVTLRHEPSWTIVVFRMALFAPAVYALGCGAVLFAGEREDGTAELLRSLPLSAVRLLTGKLSFGIASAGVMLGLLLWVGFLAEAFSPGSQPFLPGREGVRYMLLLSLHMLVWGTFFSLLTGKVLHAVMLTPIGVLPVLRVLSPVVALSVFAVVLFADFWLARRWLAGRQFGWLAVGMPGRSKESAAKLEIVKETASPWRRAFGRLSWQEWRHARSLLAVYCGVAICLLVASTTGAYTLNVDFDLAFLIIPSAPLLMGVWSFRGEQAGRRFRFPAERGISPQAVWLSKQLVWFPMAVIATLLFLLVDYLAESFWANRGHFTLTGAGEYIFWHRVYLVLENILDPGLFWLLIDWRDFPGRSMTALVLLFVGLGYAAGQFVSLLIPRAVTATFVGSLLAAWLWGWLYLMDRLQVPLLWSVAPLVLILLGATLARAPDWMLERPGWKPWLRIGAICLLPTALLVTGVACYRVFEIPANGPGFSEKEHLVASTPEESKTAAMYHRAALELPPPPSWGIGEGEGATNFSIRDGWKYATEEQRKWLEENQDVLKLALAATRRENCVLVDPSRPGDRDRSWKWLRRMERLRRLLLFSAWKLESQGRWDDALERHLASVRMAKHLAARADLDRWSDGNNMLYWAMRWLFVWADRAERTPEQWRAAIRKIELETASLPLLGDAIKNEHVLFRQRFLEGSDIIVGQMEEIPPSTAVVLNVFRRMFPSEEARTLRLLDAVTVDNLRTAKEIERFLVRPGGGLAAWKAAREKSYYVWERLEKAPLQWKWSTPLMADQTGRPLDWRYRIYRTVDLETKRRGLLLSLALSAWREEHGELPSRLDVLVGEYFGELPFDPWSGRPFNYRPEGFPVPVNSPGFAYRHGPKGMGPGLPLLWSVGRQNQQIVVRTGLSGGPREYRVVNSNGVYTPSDDGTGVISDRTLSLDLAFPIP